MTQTEFSGHLPSINEIAAANGLQEWSSQGLDEQSQHVGRLVFQYGLTTPMVTEATNESNAYGSRIKQGFVRGFSVGAVVLDSVGTLPIISSTAAQLGVIRYSELLDPPRSAVHADNRTPKLWGSIQSVNSGYVRTVDRFARGEQQYPRNAFRRGAGFLFVIANEQYGLQFQSGELYRQQIDAIKVVGLLNGFDEEQGLDVLHELTGNNWPWHKVLERNKLAVEPIRHLIEHANIDSESAGEDMGYLLGYTLCLELLERHGAFTRISDKAAIGCEVFLEHEAKRSDAEKVKRERIDLLRTESEALAIVLDHALSHTRDIPTEAVWDGATGAWVLVLMQRGLENVERLQNSRQYN